MLALAADADLYHARMQMAVSLGWHIVIVCFGVAFPAMVLFAEWRGHRRGDVDWLALAHTRAQRARGERDRLGVPQVRAPGRAGSRPAPRRPRGRRVAAGTPVRGPCGTTPH